MGRKSAELRIRKADFTTQKSKDCLLQNMVSLPGSRVVNVIMRT
jgi:hypothetical protein